MKVKLIKKAIAMFSLVAVSVCTFGLNVTVATGPVQTQLTPTSGGCTDDPIRIKAKWEMLNLVAGDPGVGENGEDDKHSVAGAQFAASGQWGVDMDYTVCAIVHGPKKNIDNIDRVITEIYYPDTPMHISGHSDCQENCGANGVKNDDGSEIDNPSGGCGVKIEQNFLVKLDQAEGKNLVCNAIYGNNYNLIEWGTDENYEKVCNDTDGQLTKGHAAVYCADKSLTWEHPAGDYTVDVFAFDESNNQSVVFTNDFTYIETMGFQIDFDTVNYGDVKISEHKRVYGNKCYLPSSSDTPTVRNTGNVRLNMKVAQDDMGLGKQTGSSYWNVKYDARVGDLETDWRYYSPFGIKGTTPGYYKTLYEVLDLSEIEEMDFSIHVIEKWPGNLTSYTGSMWLSASKANFEACNG